MGRLAPLTVTTDAGTKPVPVMWTVTEPEPAMAVAGEMEVMLGTGLAELLTVKLTVRVVPPPGCGVSTEIGTTLPVVISEAGISAVRVWTSVYRVWNSALPSQRICEAGTNCCPMTVRVKVGWPAVMLAGDKLRMAGAG